MIVFVGWDVGAWNCDRNASSRDALVVLDEEGRKIGQPWRGNLRQTINEATDGTDFAARLLALCGLTRADHVIVAIDAAMGFPVAFTQLINGGAPVGDIGVSARNPYLRRRTELSLLAEGIRPLSPVQDMIGAQATKAMHVAARFAQRTGTGVWSDGVGLTLIETYPALCRLRSPGSFNTLTKEMTSLEQDILDAEVCAWVAKAFFLCPDALEPPTPDTPVNEGWIWAPKKGAKL